MNKKLIFGIVVVLGFVAVGLFAPKHGVAPEVPAVVEVPFAENRPYCFTFVHESTTDEPYRVEEHMKLSRVRGTLSGTKSGTQMGPEVSNGYVGTLDGTTDGQSLDLIFSFTVEGSQNREEELYVIDGANLVKQRYALNEEKRDGKMILVPDHVGAPVPITYTSEPCSS